MEINLMDLTVKRPADWKGQLWKAVFRSGPDDAVYLSGQALKELLDRAIVEREWTLAIFVNLVSRHGWLPAEEQEIRNVVRAVRVLLSELSEATKPPAAAAEVDRPGSINDLFAHDSWPPTTEG